MRDEEQLRKLIVRVVERLAERLGATGDKGSLIVVFTAATVGFGDAVQEVKKLILDGFRVQLAFSEAASRLLAQAVRDQLDGFPCLTSLEASNWLGVLQDARAVVVPLLSLNTLSKLSLLIADNLAVNLILHGLLMGKPVVVAQNGAEPTSKGRRELGFHRGSPVLTKAMRERLQTIAEYGCRVTVVRNLRETVHWLLRQEHRGEDAREVPTGPAMPPGGGERRFITAADVLHAWRTGGALNPGAMAGMTPLARELAVRHRVVLTTEKE